MADGERDLWCAVIRQAFMDATLPAKAYSEDGQQARQWLTTRSRDLAEVCALADLDPEAVRIEAIERCAALDAVEIPNGVRRPNQARKRVKRIEFNGLNLTFHQWSARTGLSQQKIAYRFNQGWSAEDILTKGARAQVCDV